MYYENPSGYNFLHDIYGSLLEFGCISSLLLNLIGRCCTLDFFSCLLSLLYHCTEESVIHAKV